MLTDVPGVRVGHWTDLDAKTGCTAILLPPGTVASGEVRGGAPATREFALLDPSRLVQHVDAVCLSGGSAFGLAAGHGVMEFLAEQGRGFPTAGGNVPIVVGMSLYDLAVGDGAVRPGEAQGRAAAAGATEGPHEVGPVGAGTGATIGKWSGRPWTPGGIGTATIRFRNDSPNADDNSEEIVVSALVAVNAYGSIDNGTTTSDPGARQQLFEADGADKSNDDARVNTTIGVIVTNAAVDKIRCQLLAQSGHDGLARALHPAHTAVDGDALVAAATGAVEVLDVERLRVVAQHAVTLAVRSLVPAA